jgi:hypothetical protein
MLCVSKDKVFLLIFLICFTPAVFEVVSNSECLTHLRIARDEIRVKTALF